MEEDIDYGGKLTQTGTGANTFAGDIMPAAENLYDIGSASVQMGGYFCRSGLWKRF